MAEDGIGTSKVFYVHRGGIVTADSYFGVCRGGIIVLTRYEDDAYNGVFQAVVDFEQKYGNLLMLPLGDLTGTMMVIHP